MKRYFIINDISSNSVVVSPLIDIQPENSVLYFANDFIKPCFDVFPNPSTVVEGATTEEIDSYNSEIIIQKKKEAHDLLKETDWYVIRFQETGKLIPQDILELRDQIRNNY